MQEQKKKMTIAILLVVLLSVLVRWSEKGNVILTEEGGLLRRPNGKGGYEAEVVLTIDETEETEWTITVPEQLLTRKEEETLLEEAVKELEEEFIGENASLDHIRNKVVIRNGYREGKVSAEWVFSNQKLILETGQINDDVLETENEIVEATATLSCEDSVLIHKFSFVVYKQEKSEEEYFYEKLEQYLSENGKKEGTEILWLPEELEGHALVWKTKESSLPLQVLFLGMVVVILLPALEAERENERRKKREEELIKEYPELVNKLALLLGAGMTMQGAWRLITEKYGKQRENTQGIHSVVYEEMLITQREMESGQGEAKSYLAFGERCGLPKYRKLSGYLVQGLQKGNRSLCELLEQEAEDAFAERKNMARQYGEEVGTKLLFPMLLMLGIVVFVIMVPAIISFQSGV